MIILIDNGHGIDTPGKRSPDGRFREYLWTREVAAILLDILADDGFDVRLVVPETNDIALRTRCARVNRIVKEEGPAVLLSIHANAAGDGSRWMNGRGFSVYTSPGRTDADRFATMIDKSMRAEFPGARFRADTSDGDVDYEARFYILTHTNCPAVLAECWFYDNIEECCWLLKENTKYGIAMGFYWAIRDYLAR